MVCKNKLTAKILSLIFAVSLILTSFVPLNTLASDIPMVWNGTQTAPTEGEGTSESPILIENAEQLAWLVNLTVGETAGKYYKLAADIKLNDTAAENWKENATPWFAQNDGSPAEGDVGFAGTLDGDGHIVSGLYFNNQFHSSQANLGYWTLNFGLLPKAKDATVKNIGVINSDVTVTSVCDGKGSTLVGLLAGRVYGAVKIEGCFVDDTASVTGKDVAGGLVGSVDGSLEATNCYSAAKLTNLNTSGTIFTGGIAGSAGGKNFAVKNSYSVNHRITPEYWTDCSGFTYTNVYTDRAPFQGESVSGLQLVQPDDLIGRRAQSIVDVLGDAWVVNTVGRPYLKIFGDKGYNPPVLVDNGAVGRVWSGKLAHDFTDGTGTESDPYIIETPEQLAKLANLTVGETAGKYYKLAADIKLNDTAAENWKENATPWFAQNDGSPAEGDVGFAGTLDGDGHIVSGLYFNNQFHSSQANLGYWTLNFGLLPKAKDATVKNIGIINSDVIVTSICNGRGDTLAGLIIGKAYSSDTGTVQVENCFADATAAVTSKNTAGAVIGADSGNLTVNNCYSYAKLTGKYIGMIGDVWANVNNETFKDIIVKNSYAVGYSVARNDSSVVTNIPSKKAGNFTYENLYSTVKPYSGSAGTITGVTRLHRDDMIDIYASATMEGLDSSVWTFEANKLPYLTAFADYTASEVEFAAEIGDVNCDGSINGTDLAALRKQLLGITEVENKRASDTHRDNDVDLLDLIALKKAVAAAPAE